MATVSKTLQKLLLQGSMEELLNRNAVYAIPYKPVSAAVAMSLAAVKAHQDKVKEERTNVWKNFKDALDVAATAGHTVSAMRVGLALACDEVGIPEGSFRSYLSTVTNLYADIMDPDNERGTLTLAQAKAMSIQEARKRFAAPPSDIQRARQELAQLTADWTPEQLQALVTMARGEVEDEVIEVVEKAAHDHAEAEAKRREEEAQRFQKQKAA